MKTDIKRTTIRRVALDRTRSIRLKEQYGARDFRAVLIKEILVESPGREPEYGVHLSGPSLTKNGNDHSRNRGNAWFNDEGFGNSPLSQIPEELCDLLVGPVVLAGPMGNRLSSS